jgi:multiple sugar transport system permease protein
MTPEMQAEPASASSRSLGDTGSNSTARPGSQGKHRRHGSRAAYAYILAAFLYLAVFVLYPIANAIWISLTKTDLLSPTKNAYVGLQNYQGLIESGLLQHSLWLTVIFVAAVSVLSMLVGVGAALLVETLGIGKSTARTLLALPWTIPGVVIALLFSLILDQRIGVINQTLQLGNLRPVNWLTDDTVAMISVIGVTVWNLFPFVMLVTMAALSTVPAELSESASVDGAGSWAMARRITLPYIAPTLSIVSLFLIIWAFQQFQVLWIMTQGGPIDGTDVISIALYRTAFLFNDLGSASAIGVVAMIPALLITLFYFRVTKPMGAH